MKTAFIRLSDADLRDLASVLKAGRMTAPYSELQVNRVLSSKVAADVSNSLRELASLGFDEQQIATTLELIILDRSDGRKNETPIELVELQLVSCQPIRVKRCGEDFERMVRGAHPFWQASPSGPHDGH